MIGYFASLFCAIITLGMAVLQLSLTLGAPFGEYVLGGQTKVLPKKMRRVSITYFFLFLFIAIPYLQKANMINIGMSTVPARIIMIVNSLFLAYAIVGNGFLTKSKKERYVMTPLSIIQFVFSIIAFF